MLKPQTISILVMILHVANAKASGVSASPYRLDPVWDTTVTAGLAVTLGAASLYRTQAPFAATCNAAAAQPCNPDRLLGLDRYAVGKKSRTWTVVSDLAEYGGVMLPFLLDGVELWLADASSPWGAWATDAVVILEAQLLAGLANNLIKLSSHRPRPRQYDEETYKAVPESVQSFPCGHCLAATTGTTAYAVTHWLRNPDSPSRYFVTAVAAVYSAVGSWARVESGAHFATDVLAGVAIGAMCGVLLPWAHRVKDTDDTAHKPDDRLWRVQLLPQLSGDGSMQATLIWHF